MTEAMARGYHVYKEIWCADIGEKLSSVREVLQSVHYGCCKIRNNRRSHPEKDIISVFNVLRTRLDYQKPKLKTAVDRISSG